MAGLYSDYIYGDGLLSDFAEEILENLDDIFGSPDDPIPVSDALADAAGNWLSNKLSPIVFDLNGNGVELVSVSGGEAFDMDNDGFAEVSGWVKPSDGFLVRDLNGNGVIDNQGELVGEDAASTAFAKLAAMDTNGDGKIKGAEITAAKLQIWRDLDQDGKTDAGELKTLSQSGIGAIRVAEIGYSNTIAGNDIDGSGKWENTNGAVAGDFYDVFFTVNQTNSYYVGSDTTQLPNISLESLLAPQSRGYGIIKSMPLAATEDASLLTLLKNLSTTSYSNLNKAVENILFNWANVDGVLPSEGGPHIDGRILNFLEKMFDDPYLTRTLFGTEFDYPYHPDLARTMVGESWSPVFNDLKAKLLVQSVFSNIFDDAYYEYATDRIVFSQSLATYLDKAFAAKPANATQANWFWSEIANIVVENAAAFGMSEAAAKAAVDAKAGVAVNLWDVVLQGTNNADEWSGSILNDYILGNGGNDYIRSYAGADSVDGGTGDDTVRANDGNDTIMGRDGLDSLYGENGNDKIYGGNDNDRVSGDAGSDTVYGEAGDDRVGGGTENDTLDGGEGNDTVDGNDGDDYILGGNGNDTVSGNAGNDTINAGEGDDKAYGGAGNDNIAAYGGADYLKGEQGTDTLSGGVGNDTLDGGTENDFLKGDETTDTVGGADSLLGGDGDDSLYGGVGDDKLNGGLGKDTLNGAGGIDTGDYSFDTTGYTINLAGGTALRKGDAAALTESLVSIENIIGSKGADSIIGSSGDNSLSGGEGDDTLSGGLGRDILKGDGGIDTGDYSFDTLGFNINISSGTALRKGDATTLQETLSSIENLIMGSGADTITGSSVDNRLDAGGGADSISAGSGNDTLIGGLGEDTLTGANGNDIFFYSLLSQSNNASRDRITDFVKGQDKIDISVFTFTAIQSGTGSGTKLGYTYDSAANLTKVRAQGTDFGIDFTGNIAFANSDFLF